MRTSPRTPIPAIPALSSFPTAPLILTMTSFEGAAVDYAAENGITSGVVLGGDTRVSGASVREIFNLDKDAVIPAK